MKWFGPARFSHACDETPAVPTPPLPCTWCEEPFAPDDCGYLIPHLADRYITEQAWHVECWMRQIVGSVGHQLKVCTCHGGTESDPAHLTRRQAAQAAVDLFRLWGAH